MILFSATLNNFDIDFCVSQKSSSLYKTSTDMFSLFRLWYIIKSFKFSILFNTNHLIFISELLFVFYNTIIAMSIFLVQLDKKVTSCEMKLLANLVKAFIKKWNRNYYFSVQRHSRFVQVHFYKLSKSLYHKHEKYHSQLSIWKKQLDML